MNALSHEQIHPPSLQHPYVPLPVSAPINFTDFPGNCANTVKISATVFAANHTVPPSALLSAHTRPGALQGWWVLGHSLDERSSMSAVPVAPANDPIASRIGRYPTINAEYRMYYCTYVYTVCRV